jgi:hypothetical protein
MRDQKQHRVLHGKAATSSTFYPEHYKYLSLTRHLRPIRFKNEP